MAEALGIASGVIAVVDMATKIGGGSIKLKRLWDEINEVPAMLLQKAELVQGWDQLFDEAEHQLETQTLPALINNRVLLQKFTSKARAILSELQVMIDGLIEGSTIGRKYRRKIGSAKVILRKSDIKALNEKLDEILAQYQMAQSLYTMATLMQNPILSIERRSEDCHNKSGNMQAHPDPPTAQSDWVDERTGDTVVHTLTNSQNILNIPTSRTVIGRLRLAFGSQEGFQFSLRTPDWLSSSVYSVVACKSVAGWTVNLRAYEVIPNFRKTDLADLFIKDDALAIFKYLDDHRMTPFVRNYKGASLLQLACRYSSINFMSSLLERGIRLSASGQDTPSTRSNGTSWLWYILVDGLDNYVGLRQGPSYPARKVLQLLRCHDVPEEALEPPQDFRENLPDIPPNPLSVMMADEYYTFPVEERLRHARRAWGIDDFEHFLCWLPEARHNPRVLLQKSRKPGASSFIHTIARHMADHIIRRGMSASITQHPWFQPIQKHIASDIEGVSHIDVNRRSRGRTPFVMMVNHITRFFGNLHKTRRAQASLRLWMTALSSCSIDLLSYGRNEKALCRQKLVTYERSWDLEGYRKPRSSLIGITYGSRPEHWKLWWAVEYEGFAGDFWRMVEQLSSRDTELNIPGSWVEEPMNPGYMEWDRLYEWASEDSPRLIWSEYRKIRPPI